MKYRNTPHGRTQVLPDEWSAHHQPVVTATYKGTLDIWTGPLGWVNVRGGQDRRTLGTRLVANVPCNVAMENAMTGSGVDQSAGRTAWVRQFIVGIPAEALPYVGVGALLELHKLGDTLEPSTDLQPGEVLIVLGPEDGSERFETSVRARLATDTNLPQ